MRVSFIIYRNKIFLKMRYNVDIFQYFFHYRYTGLNPILVCNQLPLAYSLIPSSNTWNVYACRDNCDLLRSLLWTTLPCSNTRLAAEKQHIFFYYEPVSVKACAPSGELSGQKKKKKNMYRKQTYWMESMSETKMSLLFLILQPIW